MNSSLKKKKTLCLDFSATDACVPCVSSQDCQRSVAVPYDCLELGNPVENLSLWHVLNAVRCRYFSLCAREVRTFARTRIGWHNGFCYWSATVAHSPSWHELFPACCVATIPLSAYWPSLACQQLVLLRDFCPFFVEIWFTFYNFYMVHPTTLEILTI